MPHAPDPSPPPTFAVVGHPNKGKSSIVSTLAQDDAVAIAPLPGTTTRCQAYPMRIDGVVQYVLVDTPGFQRPRTALAWLEQHRTTAAEHRALVADFVAAHHARGEFPDECELLTPVLDGAGILYVVDGSVPYGPEYEAEMEILRWTGQPSMALINPIGSEAHVGAWESALHQYFKVVRVFNAMTAEFDKRLELLRAFGQLRDAWRGPLQQAVDALVEDRRRRRRQAARAIAHTLVDMVTLTVTRPITDDDDRPTLTRDLEKRYLDALRERERDGRQTVERIYDHHKLRREEREVVVEEQDLFTVEQWRLFGLSRGQLAVAGAAGGAAVGAGIDAVVGGHSFMAGAVIGTVVGTVSAVTGGQRVARVQPGRLLGRVPGGRWLARLPGLGPLPGAIGGRELCIGPSRNLNFAYVVLGRAVAHERVWPAARTPTAGPCTSTTRRRAAAAGHWHDRLAPQDQARLAKLLTRLARGDRDAAVTDLAALLTGLPAFADAA